MERPPMPAAARHADPDLDHQIANVLKEGASLMALQREAVEFIVRNPRCLFADGMGLGKTLVTLVSLGVLAQRCAGRRKNFRVLLAAYNKVNIGSWLGEINKFIRHDFFTVQVLKSNSEKLIKAERLIVFTTYARMRNCFNDALRFIPEDVIQPAEKRGRARKAAPPAAPAGSTSEDAIQIADEDQADDPDLLDALLAEHGMIQAPAKSPAQKRRSPDVIDVEDEDDEEDGGGKAGRKRLPPCANAVNFATHRMDYIATRRPLFQSSSYWAGRVDTNAWLPCAPLLNPGHKDDGRPPMFYISWEAIVFDEGHECKDLKAAQTKAALCLDYSESALWVTGTVTQNKLAEARSSLLMVRDASVSCELGIMRDGQGTELKGEAAQEARALKALQRVAFRRTAADLVRDQPDVLASDARTSYLINTSIRRGVIKRFFQSTKERDLHNKYVRNMRKVAERLILSNAEKKGILPAKRSVNGEEDAGGAAEDKEEGISGGNAELLKSYTRALQVCSAASVINAEGEQPEESEEFDTHSTKMNMLVEQLSKFAKGEKVIIFDHRVKVLRVAMRRLLTMGINSVLFASEVSDSVKENGLANWKRPRSGVDILLAQTKIAGTTHTWIESHIVIHLSPPINPAIEDQSNYRTYRPGQTQDVIVIILVIAGSIEELTLEIQTRKREDNKAYMSGAEVATKTKERVKINAEEALRHAEMILNSGGPAPAPGASSSARHGEHSTAVRGVPAYRECNTFEEDEQLNHIRKLFHGPEWVTEEMMKGGKVYFLDAGRSYSDAGILPRGSLIMSVASSAHAHSREMSHCAERTRLRAEAANPIGSTFTTSRNKKQKSGSTPSPGSMGGIAAEAGPRGVRVALCPVSLYVLLKSEVFDELEQLGRSYIEKRSGQARLAARVGGGQQRPLVTSHNSGFFPALSPPAVNLSALMDPDRIGSAYTALIKLRGNAALSAKASYDLQNLNTPAEVASALRDFFAPQFAVIHPIDHQLQRGKHLQDTYHVANKPNGPIELIGTTAATLTEPARNVFMPFHLDPDVLLSFSPMWHESGMDLHNRLSAPPPVVRKDHVDLYAMANEGLRKKLHWVNADAIREPINARDGMLFQRHDFSPQAYKDVLLPLLHEAASPGCSKNVRTMATAALCAYALTGCSKTPVYMIASHDPGNKVQGIFVAAKSSPSTLVGAGVYLRSPNDAQTRDVFRRTVLGNLMRDNKITKLVNAQEVIAPMEYDRLWCRTTRKIGQPVTYGDGSSSIAWGAYSQGYQSYHREPAPAPVPPLSAV
jgi:hypothetical protein